MRHSSFVVMLVVTGCGGGGSTPDAFVKTCQNTGGELCFQLPTAPLSTRDGNPSALGCGPIVPALSTSAVNVSGNVEPYGATTPIPNAQLHVYSDVNWSTTVATGTSAADGTYTMQFPAGTPNLLWGSYSAAGYLTENSHAQRANLAQGNVTGYNLHLFTSDFVESAAILVKENWDPAYNGIAGTAFDCNRLVVEHAAIAVSSTSGTRTFIDGTSLYYGVAGAVPLAAPSDQRGDTNDNGVFAVFRVPAGTQYVQMWGFVDANAMAQGEAGLTLVGEQPIHAVANELTTVALWAQ